MRELIEALHPDGAASGSELVIGLAGAATLAPDGIAWIAVRPGRRAFARAQARRQGLRISGSWLALPSSNPRLLLPLSAASTATRRLLAARVLGGRLLHAVLGWRTRVIEELAPGVGLVVQRPDARASLAWLADAGVDEQVAISAGWHDKAQLVCVGETTIVKSSKEPGGLEHEARLLRALAPSVERSGARAPSVVFHGNAGKRIALVEHALAGERVSALLRRDPSRLDAVVTQVTDWLSRWNLETRVTRALTADDLERLVFAPLRVVAPQLVDGARYTERVEALGRSLLGRDVRFAAAHNDLTTWNLLLDDGALAVVDWEAAESESLPLIDLEYFIVDATAAARRVERDVAFRATARSADELVRHACWLGHARNELERATPDSPRPFLAIVQTLADS